MGTDNKEVAWILLDEDTKPIRISFDDEPTYTVENDTNYYAINIQPPATFSAILKVRPSKIVKFFWGTKLRWYQALWLDLTFYWEKGVKCVFKHRT